jgi:hypothetical protein
MLAAACALVCATAVQTDSPNTVELTVRVQAKRTLERRVFVEACGPLTACDSGEQRKKVRLRKGRNVVRMRVQRLRPEFVGVAVTGTPWDGYQLRPRPVESVWWRFTDHGQVHRLVPSPVAHDTLRDANG